KEYIDRIEAFDRTPIGSRPLNSIITVNPDALRIAAAIDAERGEIGPRSLLAGVPIIVKDNFNTHDMPTTGGCGCWDDNLTGTDATMVEGLRGDGAVILAKASMDEFAFGFVSQFSAFQPAGQTLFVANPYDTSRTAGGSSGGTGAAIAANLGGIGFGTDTGGSIRVPSSYNQLVGIRPTVGLASRDGIIPLALSQDTGGPIARSVLDAAAALDAVTGYDPDDPVTSEQEGKVPASYTEFLDPDALDGADRLRPVDGRQQPNDHPPVRRRGSRTRIARRDRRPGHATGRIQRRAQRTQRLHQRVQARPRGLRGETLVTGGRIPRPAADRGFRPHRAVTA
ncbi:MAG TPA: amidase family protein, partial [Jiangellaceae bacterium]